MKLSQSFAKTVKDISKDEVSVNAQLLTRAGYIQKTMAGVYSYLPLGIKMLQNIQTIIRQEMVKAGAEEILLPALHPKEYWETTGRWNDLDVLFKVPSIHGGKEYALGPTHEEVVVPLAQKYIHSYRDVPRYVFQIQTKFRDEARAKSGILRGREFLMKDLYSFHASPEDLSAYYEIIQKAYKNVFTRCGLHAIETMASGGTFSKLSHEYQVITPAGEDIIFHCECGYGVNQEIKNEEDTCPECKSVLKEDKAIEVGNIFKLNTKYSDPFKLTFADEDGTVKPVFMGCYGIGVSRLMGAIVEVFHDEKGMVLPKEVAPAIVHIVRFGASEEVARYADELVQWCEQNNIEYVDDDRGLPMGTALADADLIGLPYRCIVSERSIEAGGIEISERSEGKAKVVSIDEIKNII